MDKSPVPLNGRIIGLALAIIGLAIAVRVAWTVVEPIIPGLLSLAAVVVIYQAMFRGGKH